jgi:hypothetical protein
MALAAALLLAATVCQADCAFYDIRCAASEAGREAAEKVAKELPEVGFKTVNYWGYILEMYHTGTPDQKAWATKLIKGELGIDPNAADINRQFEVAVTFTGVDTRAHSLHVAVLEDSTDDATIAATIVAGTRDEMSAFQAVDSTANVAPPKMPVNLEEIRQLLYNQALSGPEYMAPSFFSARTQIKYVAWCATSVGGLYQPAPYPCQPNANTSKAVAKFLSNLIISALNPQIVRTSGVELRYPWMLNPRLTVLIPKHELDSQPSLEMSVTIYRVNADGTRTPTRRFQHPLHMSHEDLTIGATLYTSQGKYVDHDNKFYGRRIEIYSP